MADRKDQIKELTDRLEEGVREVFESGRYEECLRVMSKSHHYSYRNILLIQMQKPYATWVAGYKTWKKKFCRQVNKGEKAIKILASAPYKTKKEISRNGLMPVFVSKGMPASKTTVFDTVVKDSGMLWFLS